MDFQSDQSLDDRDDQFPDTLRKRQSGTLLCLIPLILLVFSQFLLQDFYLFPTPVEFDSEFALEFDEGSGVDENISPALIRGRIAVSDRSIDTCPPVVALCPDNKFLVGHYLPNKRGPPTRI